MSPPQLRTLNYTNIQQCALTHTQTKHYTNSSKLKVSIMFALMAHTSPKSEFILTANNNQTPKKEIICSHAMHHAS